MSLNNIEMEFRNRELVIRTVSSGMSAREKLSRARLFAYLQKTKQGVLNSDPKDELSGHSVCRR